MKYLIIIFLIILSNIEVFIISRDLDFSSKTSYDIALKELWKVNDKEEEIFEKFTPRFKDQIDYYKNQIKTACTSISIPEKNKAVFVFTYGKNKELNQFTAYKIFYNLAKYNLGFSVLETKTEYMKFIVTGESYNIEGFSHNVVTS